MFFLKMCSFGQARRVYYRFQIYNRNRLVTQVGFYDPYTCRGGFNLNLLQYYIKRGLFFYNTRYGEVIFFLLGAAFYLNYSDKFPKDFLIFLKSKTPYRSQYQKYLHHFAKYKRAISFSKFYCDLEEQEKNKIREMQEKEDLIELRKYQARINRAVF